MMLRVIKDGKPVATYCNVTSDSNIDGTLRLKGWDEDGLWVATWPPGTWDSIELEDNNETR